MRGQHPIHRNAVRGQHPPPARELAALGAEVVRADITNKDELARAFRAAYGVYSLQNFIPDGTDSEILQGRNVGDAAKANGVQHVVYGSAGPGAADTGVGSWASKLMVQGTFASCRCR